MDLIPDYCRRKHGEAFEYPDERTKGILSETYGIMIYQEQVMQMAQVIGGYTLGGADLLRRAMGKKDAAEMARHRQIFRDGAAKNNLSQEKADEIFDLMEKFAGYGFNKSHACLLYTSRCGIRDSCKAILGQTFFNVGQSGFVESLADQHDIDGFVLSLIHIYLSQSFARHIIHPAFSVKYAICVQIQTGCYTTP